MIQTVILDLDDTLYDEIDYCKSGFAAVADHLARLPGAPTPQQVFQSFWRQFNAGNRTRTFNAVLDELAIACDDSLIREMIHVYRNHTPNITLPADSRRVLDGLTREYDLALLTDGFLPAQKLKVEALGIEHYFKTIVYTEQLGRESWKPSPAGFDKILQTLNADPQAAACVADNELKDFIAPNALGITTIQLIRPNRIHTQSPGGPNAKPQHIIHQITDLPPLLEQL